MQKPTYEAQNRWLARYVAPIFIDGGFGKVRNNIRESRRETTVKRMADAGVYNSLLRLEKNTSEEIVFGDIKTKINKAARQSELDIGDILAAMERVFRVESHKISHISDAQPICMLPMRRG